MLKHLDRKTLNQEVMQTLHNTFRKVAIEGNVVGNYHIPEGSNVLWTSVLVLEVVSLQPNVLLQSVPPTIAYFGSYSAQANECEIVYVSK